MDERTAMYTKTKDINGSVFRREQYGRYLPRLQLGERAVMYTETKDMSESVFRREQY
jgi:hypothetical protein